MKPVPALLKAFPSNSLRDTSALRPEKVPAVQCVLLAAEPWECIGPYWNDALTRLVTQFGRFWTYNEDFPEFTPVDPSSIAKLSYEELDALCAMLRQCGSDFDRFQLLENFGLLS